MTDLLVLELVEKKLMTDQMELTVGYDIQNLTDAKIKKSYKGEVKTDRYGRKVPKHAHGTVNLGRATSSSKMIIDAVMGLYDSVVDPKLLIRRITVTANHAVDEAQAQAASGEAYEQMDLFTDYDALEQKRREESERLLKERKLQEAVLSVKKRYGKNAVLKGMNFEEGATAAERNRQIGGHKA